MSGTQISYSMETGTFFRHGFDLDEDIADEESMDGQLPDFNTEEELEGFLDHFAGSEEGRQKLKDALRAFIKGDLK